MMHWYSFHIILLLKSINFLQSVFSSLALTEDHDCQTEKGNLDIDLDIAAIVTAGTVGFLILFTLFLLCWMKRRLEVGHPSRVASSAVFYI